MVEAILMFFKLVFYVIIAQVIMSWLIQFNVLNLRQPFVSQIWDMLNRALEPIYAPIRRFMPMTGGLDFTPMVVIILLSIIQKVLVSYAMPSAPPF